MNKFIFYVVIIFCAGLFGCSEKPSSIDNYTGPSGLSIDQMKEYNKLTPEGKAYVRREMNSYDNLTKNDSDYKNSAGMISPNGRVFEYTENEGKIVKSNNDPDLVNLIMEIINEYEIQQEIPDKDKWETEKDYKNRTSKLKNLEISELIYEKISDKLFAIKLNEINGWDTTCGFVDYSVDKKILEIYGRNCIGRSIFQMNKKENPNILVACCIKEVPNQIKIGITNASLFIGRGFVRVKSDGSLQKFDGVEIEQKVPMSVEKAKTLFQDVHASFAEGDLELIYVGKIPKRVAAPLKNKTIAIDLQKILLVKKSSGEILWKQSIN